MDRIDKSAYVFDERRCLTALDPIGIFESMHAAAILQSRMKDVYDGNRMTQLFSLMTLCNSPVSYSIYNTVPSSHLLDKHPHYHMLCILRPFIE